MRVAILTDTNSGISVKEGKEQGIFVIPMPVIVDGQNYLENESITHEQLYAQMLRDKDVSTSQPAPIVLTEQWDKLLRDGYDEIVYIPMSSGLSNSCETAMHFAEGYGGKVFVADNHRISVTLRESVFDAKALAERGLSGVEIKERLDSNAYQSSIYVTVNSMKYLIKNGRATRTAAMIATVLNVKPVLTIQGGKLDAFMKVRGIKKSMSVMIEAIGKDIKNRFADVPRERLHIGAAGTLDSQADIDEWLTAVKTAFPGCVVYYNPLSCSIACHVGIGAIGIGISKTEAR